MEQGPGLAGLLEPALQQCGIGNETLGETFGLVLLPLRQDPLELSLSGNFK
jgi:hypothetical protein